MADTHPDELFNAARRLDDRAARDTYLDEACAGDADVRQQVEALLAAYEQAHSFLNTPAAGPADLTALGLGRTTDQPPLSAGEQAGSIIGRYKLLERIGEGGFGVVYMAEQQHPVRRKVALKVIKPGLDTRQVIARFEAERQALALMDHENIARVLDAGATDAGRPYFVMELVHGVPITEYCDANQLAPRQRLELFVQVCRAVQHAHTKGIIHRDIKPSNVLVTLHDGVAVPKVIDFGIAKATGQQLTEKTLFTNFAQMIGTPLYMSPEQAEMTGIDVDTRSDVYSLGVLLYELLTGTTPLDKERFKQAAFDEVRRMIREEEPPPPSTRLSTMGEQARSISAAQRHSDPRHLGRLVRGELDWIVMRALEKDRRRRYETANGLATDVERYLADEPVAACPPSATYRLRKLTHRYRVPLAVAAGFLLLLLTGIVVSVYQAIRIGAEQRRTLLQKVEADKQRDDARSKGADAEQQRKVALHNEQLAQQRLAENLAVTGDALLASQDIFRARDAYQQSTTLSASLGLSPLTAQTGLTQTYVESPAALLQLNYTPPTPVRGVVAFSPDGRTLVTADTAIQLWDVVTGRKLQTLFEQRPEARSIAFSPDGTMLLFNDDDHAGRILEVATGKQILHLPGPNNYSCSAFCPDGKHVVTGSDRLRDLGQYGGYISVWRVSDGSLVRRIDTGDGVFSIAVSPDGRHIANGTGNGQLQLWDFASGASHRIIRRQHVASDRSTWVNNPVDCVAFTPDGGGVLAADRRALVTLRDVSQGTELRSFGPTEGVTQSLAVFRDGSRFVSTGQDGIVRIWDIASGAQVRQFAMTPERGGKLALSPDDQLLACAAPSSPDTPRSAYQLWDISGQTDAATVLAHDGAVTACAASPDGRLLLSGGADGAMVLWDVATWQVMRICLAQEGRLYSVNFLADGRRALTAAERGARLWDLRDGRCLQDFAIGETRHGGRFAVPAPDGRTAFIKSSTSEIRSVDVDTGTVRQTIRAHWALCAAFSPDGKRLLTGHTANRLTMWELESGLRKQELTGHRWWVTCATQAPDGRTAVTGSWDCDGIVWDLDSGRQRHVLRGHTGYVNAVAVSPDSAFAVTGSEDSTVRLWDLRDGKQVRAFPMGPEVRAMALALLDGGNTIAASGTDANLHIWRLDWGAQLQQRSQRLAEAQRALQDQPDHAEALREIGEWYIFRGRWDLALGLLERARAGGARVSALLLARCYWKAGRASDAEQMFDAAAKAAEAPPDYLAMCRASVRPTPGSAEVELAAQDIAALADKATWNSPRKAASWRLARLEKGFFDRVAELRPNETSLWIGRAQHRLFGGRWQDAAADYAKVIDARPVHDEFVEYGHLLLFLGDVEGYRQLCEKLAARENEPRNTYCAYIMARTCAAGPQSTVDATRVVKWAEQAVDGERSAWRLHALGLALYRAGDAKRAVLVLDESNKKNWGQLPSHPQNWFVLAMTYHRLGNPEESRRCLEEARRGMMLVRADTGGPAAVAAPEWIAMHALEREAESVIRTANSPTTRPAEKAAPQ